MSLLVTLSSRNESKIHQIETLFKDTSITIQNLDQAGIVGEAIEDGTTLQQNAMKKAVFAWKKGTWAMADDTGFFITALGGEPGVYAARWAGEDATTAQITAFTLEKMKGKINRSAQFKTVVCLITPEGKQFFFDGMVSGTLLEAERVKAQPQMPYSGIFVAEGTEMVWAQMTTEEENKISHRGKAFKKVLNYLLSKIK